MNDFKQTDIGPIPVDWDVVKISSYATVEYGKANPKSEGIIPLIGSGGIFGSTSKALVEYPTIVIGRKGTAGSVQLFYIPTFPTDTTFYLRWKSEKPPIEILFNSFLIRPMSGLHAKTTMPSLQRADVENFIFPLPPQTEQIGISSILSQIQKAIEKQEQIIKTTQELKKALMQKLFTEGISNEPQKQTEIGLIPQSWEVVQLGSIVDFTTGKLNSNAAKLDGQFPFFTCSQGDFWIDTYAFDQEAILLSGNNARAIYSVKYFKGKFNAYQRTYVISIKNINEYAYIFLKYALQFNLERLRIISIGTSTKYLTLGLLTNLNFIKPALTEQKEIALALSSIDSKIECDNSLKMSVSKTP